jgi:hypothetical protein
MKHISTLLLLSIFYFLSLTAQDCKAYLPYEEGTVSEMVNYNKKDKPTGKIVQEITRVEHKQDMSIFGVKQIATDEKGKNSVESNFEFSCKEGIFYIDMNTMISEEQMSAYEDMEMEVSMTNMEIPSKLEAGQKLNDATMTVKLISDAPVNMNFTVNVVNRTVEGFEKVTTPAGTFDCVKLTQDVETKTVFSMVIRTITWYAEGVGTVRSESYNKGKLMGYTVLEKLKKL